MSKFLFVCTGLLFLIPVGAQQTLRVTTLIDPVVFFAQEIGGKAVFVQSLLPPLTAPETFMMKFSALQSLAETDIYFSLGFLFDKEVVTYLEEWHPEVDIVYLTEGMDLLSFTDESDTATHEEADKTHEEDPYLHEDNEERLVHGDFDPHVWLGIPEVRILSRHILQAFIRNDPANTSLYQQKQNAFIEKLGDLDTELRQRLRSVRGSQFFIHHPTLGYYARSYGLEQISLENEGRELTPRVLVKRIRQARTLGIQGFIVQPQFSGKNIQAFADAVGGQVFTVDILGDWIPTMRNIANTILISVSR